MKCQTIYRFICEHLDEQSESTRFRKVREHLAKCPPCQRMLKSLKKTVELYCAEPRPKVPASAHRQLMHALKKERRTSTE